jgi:hypothetical protein
MTYTWFLKEIATMKHTGVKLNSLHWSDDLSISAANYLKDLEGCRALPDQIFDDKPSTYYVDELNL